MTHKQMALNWYNMLNASEQEENTPYDENGIRSSFEFECSTRQQVCYIYATKVKIEQRVFEDGRTS
jgi:hypothetical protein